MTLSQIGRMAIWFGLGCLALWLFGLLTVAVDAANC